MRFLTKGIEDAIDDCTEHLAEAVRREPIVQAAKIIADIHDKWLGKFYELLVQQLRPPTPGPLKLFVTSESEDGMLNFNITLPPPGAADVVTRKFSIAIAGGEVVSQDLDGSATEATGFSGNDNDSVVCTLQDVDDAGNASPVRTDTFTLLDTIPPSEPGAMGLNVTSET